MNTGPRSGAERGALRVSAGCLCCFLYWSLVLIANPASRLVIRRSALLAPFGLEAGPAVLLAFLPALGITVFLAGWRMTCRSGVREEPRAGGWPRAARRLCRAVLPLLLAVSFLKALKLHDRGPALVAGALLAAGTLASSLPCRKAPASRPRALRTGVRVIAVILLVGLEAAIVIESLRWTRKGYYQGPIKHPLLRPLLQPLLSVDLSGAVLSGGDRLPDLGGARLEGARLLRVTARGLNFRMARLETAVLSFSDLSGSNFERADLTEAGFHHGRAPGADFSRAVLIGTVAIGGDFRDASFRGARLDYAKFNAVDASGSDWTDADFYGLPGQIVGSSLRGAVFRNANLTNLLLLKDDFTDADLAGASLRGAKLWRTVFKGANLEGADLRDADGEAGQLGEAATLYNARLDPPLAEALMREYPRLFERPAQAPTLRPTGSAGASDSTDD